MPCEPVGVVWSHAQLSLALLSRGKMEIKFFLQVTLELTTMQKHRDAQPDLIPPRGQHAIFFTRIAGSA